MLGRKKTKEKNEIPPQQPHEEPIEASGPSRSRSIFSYYLPVIVVAVVAIAGFTYAGSWLTSQAASERQQRLAHSLATAVQQQVAAVVKGKRELLVSLAREPRLASLASDEKKRRKVASQLQRHLADSTLVVLIPASWNDEQVLQGLHGSYAAAQTFQKVLTTGKAAPAEVIRDRQGRQHFMLAAPVMAAGEVAAVLFAGFPVDLLTQGLKTLGLSEARVVLEQVVSGGSLLLASSGDSDNDATDGELKVPGTLWRVRYAAPVVAGMAWPELASLVAGGALLLLAVTLLGYRKLARDLKADMGLMVALVDATLKRKGSATPVPHLAEARPAMELLARYAQATFTAAKAARGTENHAGMAQMVVEDLERQPAEEMEKLAEEQLPVTIFRASTIRGRSGMELNEEIAQAVGVAMGSLVQESGGDKVLVARDNRATSDAYASSLVAGILASGCDVIDMGEAPAPLLNYAMRNSAATSGVMVTGGHNPPEYNGFKLYLDCRPLDEHDCLELRERILEGRFAKGMGKLESRDFSHEYVRHVTGDVQLVEPLKLVVDCGNGVAGPLAQRLFEQLGCEVIPLFCEPDGGFPNHLADPSDEGNLQALMLEVQAQGAQLGVALDVDGDALAIVDEQGKVIHADQLLMLLAGDIIRRNPGADVVYDVACSAMLPEFILSNGGRPIMWRTGHAQIQAKLKENGGLLGGELSGHIYIGDRWYGFDDGLYVTARLLEILSLDSAPVSSLFEGFSSGFTATPLLTLEVPEGRAEEVIGIICREADFGEADVIDLDGLRLEYEHAWGLIRASHTRSALVFRFEARDQAALAEIQARFRQFLQRTAPELQLPF